MAGTVLGSESAARTKKANASALTEHMIRGEKTHNKQSQQQVKEMTPGRDKALKVK